jgi:hypothetical protein
MRGTGGVMLTRKTKLLGQKCPSAALSTTNPTKTVLGFRLGLCGERPVSIITKYVGNENHMSIPYTIIPTY